MYERNSDHCVSTETNDSGHDSDNNKSFYNFAESKDYKKY